MTKIDREGACKMKREQKHTELGLRLRTTMGFHDTVMVWCRNLCGRVEFQWSNSTLQKQFPSAADECTALHAKRHLGYLL